MVRTFPNLSAPTPIIMWANRVQPEPSRTGPRTFEEVRNRKRYWQAQKTTHLLYTYNIYIFVRKKQIMDTKLTLKLEQTIIEKAKDYAKHHRTSLSKLIENYLLNITNEKGKEEKITPLVKSLSGIINLPEEFDHKKGYSDFLINKYK